MIMTEIEREALLKMSEQDSISIQDIQELVGKNDSDRFLMKYSKYIGCLHGEKWYINTEGKEFLKQATVGTIFETSDAKVTFSVVKKQGVKLEVYIRVQRKDDETMVFDEKMNYNSSRARNRFVGECAKRIKVNVEQLDKLINNIRPALENAPEKAKIVETLDDSLESHFSDDVIKQANEILRNGNPLSYIISAVNKIHVGDQVGIAIAVLSRLSLFLSKCKPLHIQCVARSGKGKSDMLKKTQLCFKSPKTVMLHSLSGQTMFYASEHKDLDGFHVIVEEAEVLGESVPVLRALTDYSPFNPEGTTSWTVREQTHLELKIPGRQLIWLASVKPVKDIQLANRILLLYTDESEEQDKAVLALQMKEERTHVKELPEEYEVVKAIFKVLEQDDEVIIPYFDCSFFEWDFYRNRRDFPLFSILIQACTKLFKYQRQKVEGKLIATRTDFEIAKYIWSKIQNLQSQKLNKEDIRLLEMLPRKKEEAFTRAEITDKLGWSTGKIQHHLDYNLCQSELNLVASDKNEQGRKIYWKISDTLPTKIEIDWTKFNENYLTEYVDELVTDISNYPNLAKELIPVVCTIPNSFLDFMSTTFNYTPTLALEEFAYLPTELKIHKKPDIEKIYERIKKFFAEDKCRKSLIVDNIMINDDVSEEQAELIVQLMIDKALIDRDLNSDNLQLIEQADEDANPKVAE